MTGMSYAEMTLDQLFDELREAVMAEFNATGKDGLPAQAAAADREAAVLNEINKRPGHDDRFRALLDDPHPRMRLRGALSLKATDPRTALRTFRALSDSNGACSSSAYLQIGMLRRQGIT